MGGEGFERGGVVQCEEADGRRETFIPLLVGTTRAQDNPIEDWVMTPQPRRRANRRRERELLETTRAQDSPIDAWVITPQLRRRANRRRE